MSISPVSAQRFVESQGVFSVLRFAEHFDISIREAREQISALVEQKAIRATPTPGGCPDQSSHWCAVNGCSAPPQHTCEAVPQEQADVQSPAEPQTGSASLSDDLLQYARALEGPFSTTQVAEHFGITIREAGARIAILRRRPGVLEPVPAPAGSSDTAKYWIAKQHSTKTNGKAKTNGASHPTPNSGVTVSEQAECFAKQKKSFTTLQLADEFGITIPQATARIAILRLRRLVIKEGDGSGATSRWNLIHA